VEIKSLEDRQNILKAFGGDQGVTLIEQLSASDNGRLKLEEIKPLWMNNGQIDTLGLTDFTNQVIEKIEAEFELSLPRSGFPMIVLVMDGLARNNGLSGMDKRHWNIIENFFRTLMVKNLPLDVDDSCLVELFTKLGEIESVRRLESGEVEVRFVSYMRCKQCLQSTSPIRFRKQDLDVQTPSCPQSIFKRAERHGYLEIEENGETVLSNIFSKSLEIVRQMAQKKPTSFLSPPKQSKKKIKVSYRIDEAKER